MGDSVFFTMGIFLLIGKLGQLVEFSMTRQCNSLDTIMIDCLMMTRELNIGNRRKKHPTRMKV